MKTRKNNLKLELFTSLLVLQAAWLGISLIPELTSNLRILTLLAFVLISSFIFWLRTKNSKSIIWFFAIGALIAITTAGLVKLLKPVSHYALQFLTLGIDNDPHIQMYKDIVQSDGQINLISYPSGQQAMWNLITKYSNLNFESTTEIVTSFATLTILTWLLIITLISLLVIRITKLTFESFAKIYALALVFFFGSFSFMVVGGYPHYMWAILVLLLISNALQETSTFSTKVLILLSGTWILFFTFVIFSAVTGLSLAVLLIHEARQKYRAKEIVNKRNLNLWSVGLVSLLVAAGIWTVNRYTLNVVADDASAEPISVIQMSLTALLIVVIFKFSSNSALQIKFELKVLMVALALVAVGISIFTIVEANKITYFAVKQIQFSLLVILAVLLAASKFSLSNLVTRSSIILLVLAQFIPVLNPKIFDGVLMGSGIKGFLFLSKPDKWSQITFEGKALMQLSEQVQLTEDECAVFWKPDRVLISKTTWLNAINPNANTKCQGFQYLELAGSEQKLIEASKKLDQQFLVIYSETNKPDVAELSSANIRLFELTN